MNTRTTVYKRTISQICILFFALSLPLISFGQNAASEGMQVQTRNFSTFIQKKVSATDELWKKYNDPSDYDHPEFGTLPADAPCTECVEVYSKRKADERYFINTAKPSEFYQQKALGDLSVLKNGDYVTIDHSLRPAGNQVFESGFTFEQAGIDAGNKRTYIRTVSGIVYFNNWKLLTKTGSVETEIGSANWSDYSVGSDGMLIHNIFPGIDAEILVFRGALKTNFVIRENLPGTFQELIFRDELAAPSSTSILFEEHPEFSESTGKLVVKSGSLDVLSVGESVLFARNGPKDLIRTGTYRLSENKMDVVVPFEWINDNIGNYELIVDPVVTGTATLAQASITGSRYNASCSFTNSCDYTLPVPRPANATITDVAWTFTYSAAGACWLQDGGIKIGVGSCLSPATAGYYWFCNSIGGGTCAGTNQTIYSDVASCIPAPGCTVQNINFMLKFYRSCWGATGAGCNNNACIGAASPWTMTITGNTISYVNTATPVTLSAPTVCQGGTITASTSGAGGVSPYTYNWSFSSTGTPSVGTGASATITFPTAGTVTLYSFVTDACGNVVTSSKTVTVTPGPTITVTPSPASICTGGSAVLTASGATTYTWSPATGLSATTGASVTANPAATTTYTITGTTSGCSGTSTVLVTVNPLPVISVTPNPAVICAGGSIVLSASGASAYSWSPSTGLSATTGASVTANPAATTTYTVTGTTGAGCAASTTVTVTVNSNPIIAVSPVATTICNGASVSLTASGASTYAWSPAASLSSGTGAAVTATPTATTTYTVTGTDANGCTATASSTVTVNPAPTITATPATICTGASTPLTASGASTYTWSPATGLSATTGATVTANPTATTTYTITGTNAAGCTGTVTVTVTVNPLPVITVPSATICSGSSASLTASGASTYTWSPSTGLSATMGATVTANPTATTTYTITGTNANGCVGTTTATVTVNALPVITVNSGTICTGNAITLTAGGASTYSWSPATGLSATTGNPVTATPTATTTYTVTGTDASGCISSATSTVTVNPNAVITVSPSPATICSGASTALTASGAATYAWSPATGLSATTGATVTANPTATTTYTITGTNAAGCTGTATVTVTVNALPAVAVSPASPAICAGSSTPLTASGASTYSWSPSTGLSATTGATVTANPTATTTYTVTGTDANGCVATATSTVTVNPIPVLSITPSAPSICSGGSVTLTASGAAILNWSPSTGLSSGSGSPVTASPASTTTYTLTGTQNGCSSTQTVTVTVNANPVITVNSPSICEGTTATLVAAGAGTSGTYSWSPSTGLSATTGSPVTATPTVTTSYIVTGTNAAGCSGTATSNVTIKPLPVVSASNNGPLCPGEQLLLSSTSTAGSTFSWTGPQSFTSTAQNPSIASVSSANAGTYTVTATLNGCTATASTTFTMNPVVSTAITPAGPFCADAPAVTLTAATAGGVWSGTGITDPATGAFDPSAAATGSNTITYQIPGGCSNISTASIIVNPLPQVSFASDKTTGCPELDVQFTNTSASQGTASWNFGDLSSSQANNPSHTYFSSGCFDVSLEITDVNGCISTEIVNDYICLTTKPIAAFSANAYEATTLYPVFQFINQSSGAVFYSWEFGDGEVSSITSPVHTYPEEPGSYTVWLYAFNASGCVDSTSKIVKVKEEVVFYIPNAFTPNGDEHNNTFQPVFTSGFDPYSYTLLVFNRWGEIIFESHDATVGWDGTYKGMLQSEGSYAWNVKFRSRDNDEKFNYSGEIILLK